MKTILIAFASYTYSHHVMMWVPEDSTNKFLRLSSNKFSSFSLFAFGIYLQVLDYTQFYLDLAAANVNANANKNEEPKWLSEYNLTTYYHGLGELSRNEISAVSLHNLADRFTNPDDILFAKWVYR